MRYDDGTKKVPDLVEFKLGKHHNNYLVCNNRLEIFVFTSKCESHERRHQRVEYLLSLLSKLQCISDQKNVPFSFLLNKSHQGCPSSSSDNNSEKYNSVETIYTLMTRLNPSLTIIHQYQHIV